MFRYSFQMHEAVALNGPSATFTWDLPITALARFKCAFWCQQIRAKNMI